ncbi:hsp-3 [Symbiodinium sp. KB8]|nr:hsp-3 [Symbiodinium sp. KB8]
MDSDDDGIGATLSEIEARRDQFRYTRTELPKQNSVALLPRQYKNAAIVFWQECKGRPYRKLKECFVANSVWNYWKKLSGASWPMVQQLAHQYLTESRRQHWANWEYQATHERRRTRRVNGGEASRTFAPGGPSIASAASRLPVNAFGQTRAQPHPSGWKRPVPQLHVLSWNASGLSSALFQEFMAWCDLQSQLDIVVIQETHWHATGDFCTGPWLAMHTSGRDDPAGFGRCSGILFLLRRHKFQDPRILELLPGRLALVQATSKQTKLPLSLIGVYQHVWRSGLPTSRNQELRRCLWDKLDQVILTTPQRHHLLACGDFNATLHTEPPIAGPSVVTSPSGHDSDLQALMQKHSMCALNTWHASPAGTYYSSAGCTQIDYIFTRQSSASLLAKYARPDHGFPVGGDRLSGHYPLRASLPLRSFSRSQPQDSQPAAAPIDLPALQAAVHSATPEACHMQSCVAQRLTQVDVTNLVSAHKQVNRILLEEAAAAFPRSVWHLYHELKRPRVCTVPEILAKWRLAVQFAKVMQAEQAAQRGDQRREDGHLLSSQEDITTELRKLGLSKAVPRHIAPSAMWKLCSAELGEVLSQEVARLLLETQCTRFQKQGCVIAPYLWNYFSLLFLSRLAAQRGDEWIRRVLTLFADDVWGAWVIRSELDLDQAVLDVSLILETLESLDMTINYTKTAILLRLVGRDASRLRRQHTYMKAGRLYLRVWVHGRECGTPIKDQHEYLGTVVTYRHRHQRNMQHRLQACAGRYQGLRKLLNGSHHLTEQHRLWQACICTSAMYAQHVVGVTSRTLQQLTVVLTRHLRAILRIPAHLTHVTTGDVWKRAGIPLPGWTVQHTQQQFLAKLVSRASSTPDITTEPAAIAHVQGQVDSLTATLLEAAADLAKATPAPPTVNCPFCQEVFVTENAMRVHCGIQHKSVCRPADSVEDNFGAGLILSLTLRPEHAVVSEVKVTMFTDLHDYHLNDEAEIFANCWQGPQEFLLSPSPHSPDNRSQKNSSASAQDPVRLLTRVVLQQEQTISRLRHDKGFVLFMKQGEDGTLGALMKVAREWNAQKSQDNSKVTSPLRTVLLSSMTRELLKLAQQAVATEENKARMVKAEWLTSASEWTYRKWNHTERRLEVDSNRPPLQHAEIVRILTYLLENLTGEAIQRFNSTVQLPKPEQKGAQMATFGLEVSLRGQNATELYQGFERLCSNSIMSLIGVSMKKDTLPQSPAARTLANLYYQR